MLLGQEEFTDSLDGVTCLMKGQPKQMDAQT